MNKKAITAIVVVAVLLVVIGVAYAALSATLNINGTTTVKKQTWGVAFTGLKATAATANKIGAKEVTINEIGEGTTTMTWSASLNEPGDYAEFVVAVENTGSIDAVVATSNFNLNLATATLGGNVISYSLCYVNDINGTSFVKADGSDSSICVSPAIGDVYYGTTAVAADNAKIGKRFVKVKVFFDPDAVSSSGSNLNNITAGTNVPGNTNSTQTQFTITTTIPFVQYTGA